MPDVPLIDRFANLQRSEPLPSEIKRAETTGLQIGRIAIASGNVWVANNDVAWLKLMPAMVKGIAKAWHLEYGRSPQDQRQYRYGLLILEAQPEDPVTHKDHEAKVKSQLASLKSSRDGKKMIILPGFEDILEGAAKSKSVRKTLADYTADDRTSVVVIAKSPIRTAYHNISHINGVPAIDEQVRQVRESMNVGLRIIDSQIKERTSTPLTVSEPDSPAPGDGSPPLREFHKRNNGIEEMS